MFTCASHRSRTAGSNVVMPHPRVKIIPVTSPQQTIADTGQQWSVVSLSIRYIRCTLARVWKVRAMTTGALSGLTVIATRLWPSPCPSSAVCPTLFHHVTRWPRPHWLTPPARCTWRNLMTSTCCRVYCFNASRLTNAAGSICMYWYAPFPSCQQSSISQNQLS